MRSLVAAVCLLVVFAGCSAPSVQPSPAPSGTQATAPPVETADSASTTLSDGTVTPSVSNTETPTVTPTPIAVTPVPLRAAAEPCDENTWIGFWRPQNDKGGWTQRNVRVSYTQPANTSFFLVAYVDGELAGTSFDADYGTGYYHVDGFAFDLDQSFTGPHLVQVVVYTDSNENNQFDRGVDTPCLVDGEVAQAGPGLLNYSQYDPET